MKINQPNRKTILSKICIGPANYYIIYIQMYRIPTDVESVVFSVDTIMELHLQQYSFLP